MTKGRSFELVSQQTGIKAGNKGAEAMRAVRKKVGITRKLQQGGQV